MRKKIYIKRNKDGDVDVQYYVKKYGVHRSTVYRGIQRGYFWVGYHEFEVDMDIDRIDEDWVRFARATALKKMEHYEDKENVNDAIQDALLIAMLKSAKIETKVDFMNYVVKVSIRKYFEYNKKFQKSYSYEKECI